MAVSKKLSCLCTAGIKTLLIFFLLFPGGMHAKAEGEGQKILELKQIQIYLLVDGQPQNVPENILNDLKNIPLNELDDGLIYLLIRDGDYQSVRLKHTPFSEKKVVFQVEADSIKRVQDVRLNGMSYSEQVEFRRSLSTQVGYPFREKTLEKDKDKLEKMLRRKGYPNAVVSGYEVQKVKQDTVAVFFQVEKGPSCQIEQITVENFKNNYLNFLSLPIETGALCDLDAIQEALERSKENYWEEGYLRAEVELKDITYSQSKESASLVLKIQRGPKTSIQVKEDREGILNLDFLKTNQGITFSDLLLLSDADLKDILLNFYLKQGYAQAWVSDARRNVDSSGNTVIEFDLKKGPLVLIENIYFIGELHEKEKVVLDEMNLRSGKKTPFVQENLDTYRDKLKSIFLKRGFLDADVASPTMSYSATRHSVDLVFKMTPGKRYFIGGIQLDGLPAEVTLDGKKLSEILKIGDPYNFENRLVYEDEIRKQIVGQGFYYVQLKTTQTIVKKDSETSQVGLRFEVMPGPLVRIRSIFAEGDLFGKTEMIISISDLKPNVPFTQERLDRARISLMRHGLFAAVNVEPLDPTALSRHESEIDVIIRARAREGFTLSLSPGYGTKRGYRFEADFALNKLNADGLRFIANASVSQENQQQSFASSETKQILGQQLSLGLTEPLLKIGSFLTPLDVTALASYQVIGETLTNREYQTLKLISEWKPQFWGLNWNLTSSLIHEESKSQSAVSAIVQTIDSPSIKIREVLNGVSLDTRNNMAWPTSGGLYSLQYGFARFGLDSDVQYDRYLIDADYFFPIYKRLSGAISFGGSFTVDTVNRDGTTVTPPASRRATLTDKGLVRGFPETYGSTAPGPLLWVHYQDNGVPNCNTQLASIGATNLIFIKAEARYRFNDTFGMVLFGDSGSSFFTQREVNRINYEIADRIAGGGGMSNQCSVDKASLIAPSAFNLQEHDVLEQYWKNAYMSTGIGLRVILGSYATINLDYGYPLKDPADNETGCITPQDALNSNDAPACVTRIQHDSLFGTGFRYKGALHLSIGSKF